jgi:hypothetical protein
MRQDLNELERRLEDVSHEIEAIAKHNEVSRRLMEFLASVRSFQRP